MRPRARLFVALGSANAALAVILGAFGAHALTPVLSPQMLDVYHTASQYHFYHALGLLVVGMLANQVEGEGVGDAALRTAGFLMLAGIVVFCGSLYVLAVTGIAWLGAITPLGGVALIAAWIVLAVAAVRATR
ncbi:MAG: DUF423 domain-containing protein [Gemmatimonadota bacterium]|nr:DUF423 domain-containing protein [Gemmatimonadota bacterium]